MDRKIDIFGMSEKISDTQVARWLINSVENYQLIKKLMAEGKAGTVLDIAEIHKGRSSIVVGSGPTLEMCMPYMKDIVEKTDPIILCGMSNIGIFLQHDIQPHYMCVYDARDVPTDKFFAIDSLKERLNGVPLIVNPECDPSMLEFWANELKNPIYFFMRGTPDRSEDFYTHYLMGFLPQIYVVNPFMKRPLKYGIFNIGCVANIEVVVASQLGCNPINLVGVNFGYPDGKLHVNPVKLTDKGWEGTGYGQRTPEGKSFFESDNGVLTDEVNILYKMALLGLWGQLEQDVVEITVDGKYGILDLLPKHDVALLANGEFADQINREERIKVLKEYHKRHGYSPEDFRRANIERLADEKVTAKEVEEGAEAP